MPVLIISIQVLGQHCFFNPSKKHVPYREKQYHADNKEQWETSTRQRPKEKSSLVSYDLIELRAVRIIQIGMCPMKNVVLGDEP